MSLKHDHLVENVLLMGDTREHWQQGWGSRLHFINKTALEFSFSTASCLKILLMTSGAGAALS